MFDPPPDYLVYLEKSKLAFLTGVAEEYFWQGVEDALKANPPLHPEVEDYMAGYYSLSECGPDSSDKF